MSQVHIYGIKSGLKISATLGTILSFWVSVKHLLASQEDHMGGGCHINTPTKDCSPVESSSKYKSLAGFEPKSFRMQGKCVTPKATTPSYFLSSFTLKKNAVQYYTFVIWMFSWFVNLQLMNNEQATYKLLSITIWQKTRTFNIIISKLCFKFDIYNLNARQH